MELNKEIRRVINTGKVIIGSKQTEKMIVNGKAKAIILSKNIPLNIKERLKQYCNYSKIKLINFNGKGMELGMVCGKPFSINAIAVINSGKSRLLEKSESNEII